MPVSKAKSFFLHCLYCVFAATLLYFAWSYSPVDSQIVEPRLDNLQNIQEKELETFLDMNHFLTGLATAAIGGVGAIVFNRLKTGLRYSQTLLAGLTFFSASISLYFGYVSFHKVLWMLHSHFFDLSIQGLILPERLQFVTLMLSLFFFGAFALGGMLHPEL